MLSHLSQQSGPVKLFLSVGTLIGLTLVFLIPPFQAPDEHTHFYKEVHMSRGHVKAKILPYRAGASLPGRYQQTAGHYSYMYLDRSKKMDADIRKNDLSRPITTETGENTPFENTATYPPLPYVPQAVVIAVMNVFTKSVLLQMYAARIAVLVCWLVLGVLALKILPFGRWGAAALALTPHSLFLAASLANDALLFGLSFLFIALCMRSIVRKEAISRKEMWQLVIVAAALGLCKAPYFLVSFLCLAIPPDRFSSTKKRILSIAAIVVPSVILAILWQLYTKDTLINVFPDSNSAQQISYILQHPANILRVLWHTLIVSPIGRTLLVDTNGLKGWMDIQTPLLLILLDYALIFTGLYWLVEKRENKQNVPTILRPLAILIGGISLVAISLLIYITFTPVGYGLVVGLQGRYLLPLSLLLLPLLGGIRRRTPKRPKTWAGAFATICALVAVATIPLTYYRYY